MPLRHIQATKTILVMCIHLLWVFLVIFAHFKTTLKNPPALSFESGFKLYLLCAWVCGCVCLQIKYWHSPDPVGIKVGEDWLEWSKMEREIEKIVCKCRNTVWSCGRREGARNTEIECDAGRNWKRKDGKTGREREREQISRHGKGRRRARRGKWGEHVSV